MKLCQRSFLLLNFIIVALVFSASPAWSNDYYEEEEEEHQAETESESDDEAGVESSDEESTASRLPASSTAAIDFEDFLESQSQQQPSDSLGQLQVQSAGIYGSKTDITSFSSSEFDHGPARGLDFDKASLKHDSGFMRRGMDRHFGETIIANPYVRALFESHSNLRSEAGVELPSGFASLVNFVEQYIRTNSLPGAENSNGINHRTLAINVVRASFCFGNDPFMILAKMRRETNFLKRPSPTGAVGFSQMTGIGIKEVQHQMSGNEDVSLPAARTAYQRSVRCFSGISNYEIPRGSIESLKDRIKQKWGADMVFGQILVKTLVSNAKATQSYGSNAGGIVAAYEDAFTNYNGDTQMTSGQCTGKRSVQMREEYACDVISQFNKMNAQWNRYIMRSTGKDLT